MQSFSRLVLGLFLAGVTPVAGGALAQAADPQQDTQQSDQESMETRPTDDPTIPEEAMVGPRRMIIPAVTTDHPLPTGVFDPGEEPDQGTRDRIAGYILANTRLLNVSIVGGHGYIQGDILVDTQRNLQFRADLASQFGPIMDEADFAALIREEVPIGAQRPRLSTNDRAERAAAMLIARNSALYPEDAGVAEAEVVLMPDGSSGDISLNAAAMAFVGEMLWSIETVGFFSTGVSRGKIWPNRVLPYQIDESIEGRRDEIVAAIEKIEARVPQIDIREKDDNDTSWVVFMRVESGCSSFVGRVRQGAQAIRLADNCKEGTIIHEIGHALGLYHEQTHPAGENFVEVLWGNILPRAVGNFETSPGQRGLNEYDYCSIMHYSRFAFSRNGQPTLRILQGGQDVHEFVGQRVDLSQKDVEGLAALYGFDPKVNEPACPAEG